MADVSLDGDWVITKYRSGDAMVAPTEGGSGPLLTIDGSDISGTMGVNRFVGHIHDGLVSGPLAVTRMAGPPELMRQEDALLSHLGDADSMSADGDGMIVAREGLKLIELRRSGTNVPHDSS